MLLDTYIKLIGYEKNIEKFKLLIDSLHIYNSLIENKPVFPYTVYYINLDWDIKRKEFMEKQFNDLNINFVRVSGFNGKKINDKLKDTVDGIIFKNEYPKLRKTEIGCTLSHILAIKKAYENREEIILISEDDTVFGTYTLTKSLKELVENCPEDWDILQLCTYDSTEKIYNQKSFSYIPRNERDHFRSTAVYAINRKGMKKVLDLTLLNNEITIKKIKTDYPKKGSADIYIYDIVNSYILSPPIFLTNDIDNQAIVSLNDSHRHIKYSLYTLIPFKEKLLTKQILFSKTLHDMDDILTKNNQTYFLIAGTALGVFRENKFIEHDNDIDLGIFSQDYNKDIEKQILKKFNLKYRLGKIDSGYEVCFIHKLTGVRIDICIHYKEKDYYWYANFFDICDKKKDKICKLINRKFNLKPIGFIKRIFYIPFPTEHYLKESYGEDWKIPKNFSYKEGLNGQYKNLL